MKFDSLPLMEKLLLLHRQGRAVLSIRYYKHKITLYLWQGHYIEVFFNHKAGAVEKVVPLESHPSRLSFYADQVPLSALM